MAPHSAHGRSNLTKYGDARVVHSRTPALYVHVHTPCSNDLYVCAPYIYIVSIDMMF